jgi:hypothetical protein
MEGLGVAASVIAVVDLSAKIAKLCMQYPFEAKGAKRDILRLHNEVKDLGNMVRSVQRLIAGPDGAELSTSEKLLDAVNDCSTQLKTLDIRLGMDKTRKAMSRFRVQALKWPFGSKEVDKVILELERCKATISLALQADQTYVSIHYLIRSDHGPNTPINPVNSCQISIKRLIFRNYSPQKVPLSIPTSTNSIRNAIPRHESDYFAK